MQNAVKNEIRHIISGKSKVSFGSLIQTIACYLSDGTQSSAEAKNAEQIREEETQKLTIFASEGNLWIHDIDFSQYISEGAEQRVFLKDSNHVLKLNDAIYYRCWMDYFHNLLLHNYFFPDTSYELLGLTKENDRLYAVVKQGYVVVNQETDLNKVREFLGANGFINTRNNDYINSDLGIILEDLHDENVLSNNDILYFIDTVFYLTKEFWANT
jgi:hypothetical protein